MKFCAKCQKEMDDEAVVCTSCGCALEKSCQKSWVTTILLCIFLGGFGAHRFYTGHFATAVTQLILTLTVMGAFITGIWVIYDLVMIILKKFETADGSPLCE